MQNAFERGRIQGLIEALQLLQEAPLSTKEQILKEAIRKQGENSKNTLAYQQIIDEINRCVSTIEFFEEIMDKIFNPFFTTKVKQKGTGLGLSTVLSTILEHEGMITVSSKKGIGSKFTLYFKTLNETNKKEVENLLEIARIKEAIGDFDNINTLGNNVQTIVKQRNVSKIIIMFDDGTFQEM